MHSFDQSGQAPSDKFVDLKKINHKFNIGTLYYTGCAVKNTNFKYMYYFVSITNIQATNCVCFGNDFEH